MTTRVRRPKKDEEAEKRKLLDRVLIKVLTGELNIGEEEATESPSCATLQDDLTNANFRGSSQTDILDKICETLWNHTPNNLHALTRALQLAVTENPVNLPFLGFVLYVAQWYKKTHPGQRIPNHLIQRWSEAADYLLKNTDSPECQAVVPLIRTVLVL